MEKQIIEHFKTHDPVLFRLLSGLDDTIKLEQSTNYFSDLCEAIVNQQLSEKAGSTIWNRFIGLFPDKRITPELVLSLPDEKIRAVGTSGSKISYLKNLAMHTKTFDLHTLSNMENEDIIAELTKVKGIGPWSAEMFLMFSLGRENIFSYGDVGLRRAIERAYKFTKEPTLKQIESIVKQWSPYKTYACRILWKSLDTKIL